jgi:hypothetical protein
MRKFITFAAVHFYGFLRGHPVKNTLFSIKNKHLLPFYLCTTKKRRHCPKCRLIGGRR